MIITPDMEVAQLQMERPHVLILGAGASCAACPGGDAAGRPLPQMKNLIEMVGLEPILHKTDLLYDGRDFEDVYSELFVRAEYKDLRDELEEAIHRYFSVICLPDTPNLYDHLVLSLREKDVIATFNWDPFLVQAYRRNSRRFRLPSLLFLHGNVLIGYCARHRVIGVTGKRCGTCGEQLVPSRLLYPIAEKNYDDAMIAAQWRDLAGYMQEACMVTLFGYGAPESDAKAIDLLKNAWGTPDDRYMEQIEIINVLPEDALVATWKSFIHSHHYTTSDDFYSSWLAKHPRRTGEAYIKQFIDMEDIEDNPIPKDAGFVDLWDWFDRLAQVERDRPPTTT